MRQPGLAAGASERAAAVLLFQLLVVPPQFEQSDEVGTAVAKAGMRVLGRLALAGRPVAGILDFQSGGDHQDLSEAALVASRQDHAANTRIDGQPRQRPPDLRQLAAAIKRAQFR